MVFRPGAVDGLAHAYRMSEEDPLAYLWRR